MFGKVLYAPFLAQLVVIRRCNLDCGYCNEYDKTSDPVPLDELKKRLDKLKELGTLAVEFTGGEPMLHPDIYELIAYARQLKFAKVQMISNAYLLNEEKVRKLGEAGLHKMQISVDGVTPNKVTVKVLRPLRRKLEAVARAATFDVVLSGVIGSSTSDEVLEVMQFALDHEFEPRVLLIHGGDGQLKLSAEELELYNTVKRMIGNGFAEAGDYRTRLIEDGEAPFKCRAGSRYLYIDEFGVVRWCSQRREAFAVPLLDYTVADLREQFHAEKDCNARCTVGCARTCSGLDEWRGQGPGSRARLPRPNLRAEVPRILNEGRQQVARRVKQLVVRQ